MTHLWSSCSSARDSETNEKVAIKKISGCFESPVDAKRMLREVKLLSHLRHENVVGLRDILPPPSPSASSYKDVYLVYELMDTDLHQIIRSPQQLSPEHVGYFVYQVGGGTLTKRLAAGLLWAGVCTTTAGWVLGRAQAADAARTQL
jgi:serine/threonine protein kinase